MKDTSTDKSLIDFQEYVRMEDLRTTLDKVIEQINVEKTQVGSVLTWLWVWDSMKYLFKSDEYEMKASEQEIFQRLWQNADRIGFTLEYGTEELHEAIRDWLIENELIVDKSELGDEE